MKCVEQNELPVAWEPDLFYECRLRSRNDATWKPFTKPNQ